MGVNTENQNYETQKYDREAIYSNKKSQLFFSLKTKQLPLIIINYKNKNWLQFLLIVKAAVLKQQISKFYPQIQRTEASDHIYFSQRPFINVKAIFCA